MTQTEKNKNKFGKIMICLSVLTLLLCIDVFANAETIEGMIVDFLEDGFMIYTNGNTRSVIVSDDTVFDTENTLWIGDVVTVNFDDTDDEALKSDLVICHRIFGIVTDIIYEEEPYLMLMSDKEETLRVNLTQLQADSYVVGMPVTVYYNGMRTRSFPAQITAQYIRGVIMSGKVIALVRDVVTMLRDDGEIVILHRSADTVIPTEIEIGAIICTAVTPQMRLSLPSQYEANDILTINER